MDEGTSCACVAVLNTTDTDLLFSGLGASYPLQSMQNHAYVAILLVLCRGNCIVASREVDEQMVIASKIVAGEGRIDQVEQLGTDLQRQAIILPELVRHLVEGRKNICFTVGMHPANQDAAHHVSVNFTGVECEPGSAGWVAAQDEAMPGADIELGDIVIHVARAVVVGGGLIWTIPPKTRFNVPSIAWRLNALPGRAMFTRD
jgi:hypothetical protein